MQKYYLLFATLQATFALKAQQPAVYTLASPNKKLQLTVTAGPILKWQVQQQQQTILAPSAIGLQLSSGELLGKQAQVKKATTVSVNETIQAVAYKKQTISNQYNQLTLQFKGDYGIIFRAYNDGVAYRFVTSRKTDFTIANELAEYNFDKDYRTYIPHVSDLRGGERYSCSFEEFYTDTNITAFNKDTLGYLPLLVKLDNNIKAVLLEADVQNYPGMFVKAGNGHTPGLTAAFAGYPLTEKLGGYNNINYMVSSRADYIAAVNGTTQLPWRAIVISEQDKTLLNNDMVQRLSAPPVQKELSWIKPGKVAWDWWNDWNISNVDFKAGINTQTYQYYIDFAAANHLEYVILDEGWSDDWDLNIIKPVINLQQLVAYAKQKNVGIILWSTWYAITRDAEALCAKYAAMGIKGFKVDFLDRNDQKMIASCYTLAEAAARHQLLLDLHGVFPPQGLQRTWPNVVNFEGVRGMEYMKWNADSRVPAHAVTLPFIRMMAGPMDYTPGAMRNSTKGTATPSQSLPVGMGTRCNQMAMYVVYEAPLQMLADNPTAYIKEQECTNFISQVPTVFDETLPLDAQLGEYIVMARKKEKTWYIGAMTNWTERDISIDAAFLGAGEFEAVIFKDGVNANKNATDYKKEIISLNAADKIPVHLAQGGGCVIRITQK
jgi:alpha-glucosidase